MCLIVIKVFGSVHKSAQSNSLFIFLPPPPPQVWFIFNNKIYPHLYAGSHTKILILLFINNGPLLPRIGQIRSVLEWFRIVNENTKYDKRQKLCVKDNSYFAAGKPPICRWPWLNINLNTSQLLQQNLKPDDLFFFGFRNQYINVLTLSSWQSKICSECSKYVRLILF